ncbi:MAG: type II toxin-antitoxin system VapC family toxin [Syntrophales bacterium]|nr:type II toxin-antitoxin system VapC family toxin [Syntrophales bacterium]
MHYIDTSVLVAYYCPEAMSAQVQDFLLGQAKPAISSLTEVELFSAVAMKVRMGEIDHADGNRILSKFSSHMEGGLFTVISIESNHWRIARGWLGLFNTSLRTLDALHLAITSAEDFVLVTSDKRLFHAAYTLGVKVHPEFIANVEGGSS